MAELLLPVLVWAVPHSEGPVLLVEF